MRYGKWCSDKVVTSCGSLHKKRNKKNLKRGVALQKPPMPFEAAPISYN